MARRRRRNTLAGRFLVRAVLWKMPIDIQWLASADSRLANQDQEPLIRLRHLLPQAGEGTAEVRDSGLGIWDSENQDQEPLIRLRHLLPQAGEGTARTIPLSPFPAGIGLVLAAQDAQQSGWRFSWLLLLTTDILPFALRASFAVRAAPAAQWPRKEK
jgi:hypothetical protein